MKNIIFLFLLLGLTPKIAEAQAGLDTTYSRIPGYADDLHALVVDADTLAIIGTVFDTLTHTWGINLLKMDTLGNILHSHLLSDTLGFHSGNIFGNKLISTSDDGYAYSGSYTLNPDYPKSAFLSKYNHEGELDFVKYYHRPTETTGFFVINNLLQLEDDGYFLFSYYAEEGKPHFDIPHLIRTDTAGNELWSRDYKAGGDTTLMFFDAISVSANKFVVSGGKYYYYFTEPGGWVVYDFYKPYIAAMDSLGTITQEVFDDLDSMVNFNVIATSDGGYIQTINKVEKMDKPLRSRVGLRKLDSNFVQEWIWYSDYEPEVFNPEVFSSLINYRDLVRTPDGNYVAGGPVRAGIYPLPAIHTKISEEGELIWERLDHAHSTDTSGMAITGNYNHPKAMGVLSSGSTISVGSTWLPYERGWLLRISPGGCVYEDTIVCWAGGAVGPDATDAPLSLSNIEVYPNPVNDELTVFLPDDIHRKAHIYFYDATGRFLRKQRVRSGRNLLSVSDIPKGMVFYTILSEKGVLSNGKLIVEH